MATLNGLQKRELVEALIDAFDRDELEQLVYFRLGTDFNQIAGPSLSLVAAALQVVDWADARGRLTDLVEGALSERPDTPSLQAFAAGTWARVKRRMNPTLSAAELRKLVDALTHAFDHGSLERMVRFQLDIDLDHVATGRNLIETVIELVMWAESEGRVDELIVGARKENPGNTMLLEFWRDVWQKRAVDIATRAEPSQLGASEPATKPLSVFLCHSSGDKPKVRELYHKLDAAGIDPWLDEEDLLPGQHWEAEIPKAVRASDVVIVCLSRASITKAGYVQKEIGYALDVAERQPEGTIFLIPLKLEECEVPERLQRFHRAEYFQEGGHERLMRALAARAKTISTPQGHDQQN